MKRRPLLIGSMLALGLVVCYLLLFPVNIDPDAWAPPAAPKLVGVYEQNSRLAGLQRLAEGVAVGAEDVAIDSQSRIYGGTADGRILKLQPDGSRPEVLAATGGRPAGLRFDSSDNLIVCDTYKGLLSIAPDGSVRVLSTAADGIPFRLTDDLDIAADGTIYFSDASSKFYSADYMADFVEHRPNGRLLAYDPKSGTTRVVLDKLYFANGVAVSPDQSFVLVAESSKYRVQRYWLSGPRRGRAETFIENLPGVPDGISSNGRDTFWLTLAAPREPSFDSLLARPLVRKIFWRLPRFMFPVPRRYGFVLGLAIDGRVIYNLQDPSEGSYAPITNAVEHDGMLYLGSLSESSIGRLAVPRNEPRP